MKTIHFIQSTKQKNWHLLQHLSLFLAHDGCSANSDRSAFLKQSFFNSWWSDLSSWNPRTRGLSSGTSWLGASKTAISPQKTVPVGHRKWTNEWVSSRTASDAFWKPLFLLFTRYFPLQNCCPFRLDISFTSQLSFRLSFFQFQTKIPSPEISLQTWFYGEG